MKTFTIRPIPKYIIKRIRKLDLEYYPEQVGITRYYAYLTTKNKQLCKVTVALKNRYKRWAVKQVAVHFIHENYGFCKDIEYFWLGGYVVGWYDEKFSTYRKTWEDGKWYCIEDKYFDPGAWIVNIEYMKKYPEYKYSQCENPFIFNLFKYLRLYEQYPQMEYIMKMGLKRYVMSKMILRQCKDKAFCKWLYKNKERLTEFNKYYDVSVVLRAYKTGKTLDDLQAENEIIKRYSHDERLKSIRKNFRGELPRLAEYIVKQDTNTASYRDYFIACEYLKLDMTVPKNRYPHNFKRWHDIRIDEYKTAVALNEKKEREEYMRKFTEVATKYLPLQRNKDENYVCIIAKSPDDLKREGEILHHCVGSMGYDQKFTREETLIFFIRLSTTPDVPLVTVEYSLTSHKILQCYGDKDSKPDNNILHYVNKVWLPYANKKIKHLAA